MVGGQRPAPGSRRARRPAHRGGVHAVPRRSRGGQSPLPPARRSSSSATPSRCGCGSPARAHACGWTTSPPPTPRCSRPCGAALAAGVRPRDVSVGNHDVDLVRPAAAQRLGELPRTAASTCGSIPGPCTSRGPLRRARSPASRCAPAAHAPPRRGGRPHPRAVSTHRLGREAGRAARGGGGRGAAHWLPRARPSAGLRPRLPAAGMARRQRVWGSAPRRRVRCGGPRASGSCPPWAGTGGRVLRRRIDAIALDVRRGRAPNLAAAGPPSFAAEVATLTAHGTPVAWYVCGHTHRAERAPIAGTATRWANTGTWCSDIRGAGPDLDDPRPFPFLWRSMQPATAPCRAGLPTGGSPWPHRRGIPGSA